MKPTTKDCVRNDFPMAYQHEAQASESSSGYREGFTRLRFVLVWGSNLGGFLGRCGLGLFFGRS